MNLQFRSWLCKLATSLCVIVVPFVLGASGLICGIGVYRTFTPGPMSDPSGVAAGWEIVSAAWPLFVVTALLTIVGLYAYRNVAKALPTP